MKSTRVSSERIPGIYKIENILNGNVYVGSSKDIYGRWVIHKRDLNNDRHHCCYLQAAWNKYKENSFIFEILEIIPNATRNELFDSEQKWYDFYVDIGVCLYNMAPIVVTPSHNTTIDDLKNGKRKISYEQFKLVCWYLSNTNIPMTEVSRKTGVLCSTINEIYYRDQYEELTKDIIFIQRTQRDISQEYNSKLSKDDVYKIINSFKVGACVNELAKQYNVSPSTISDIYSRRTWTNLTDGVEFAPLIKSSGKANKEIVQFDLDMNYIAEYESAREANKVTGIGYKLISRVCNYQRPYTCGFIFRFKNDPSIQHLIYSLSDNKMVS